MILEKFVFVVVVVFVILKKDIDIEMLDGSILKLFKILSFGICIVFEVGIDIVDGVFCFEFVCKVSNIFIDLLNYIFVIGEMCFCVVFSYSFSFFLLLISDGMENLQCNCCNISNSQGFVINRDDFVFS